MFLKIIEVNNLIANWMGTHDDSSIFCHGIGCDYIDSVITHRALAVGRGSTAPVKNAKLPDVVTTEAWDGKDGEVGI